MAVRPVKKTLIFLLTPDKGLCGPLNARLLQTILVHPTILSARKKGPLSFLTVGKKGRRFLVLKNLTVLYDLPAPDHPSFALALKIARLSIAQFTKKEVDEVLAVYAHFASTMRQEIRVKTLLPIRQFEVAPSLGRARAVTPTILPEQMLQFTIAVEPNVESVFSAILPHYVEMWVYQILLEGTASEHSSRMIAMKQATDNAKDLIADLRQTFNRLRQESITNELLDIITGSAALAERA